MNGPPATLSSELLRDVGNRRRSALALLAVTGFAIALAFAIGWAVEGAMGWVALVTVGVLVAAVIVVLRRRAQKKNRITYFRMGS